MDKGVYEGNSLMKRGGGVLKKRQVFGDEFMSNDEPDGSYVGPNLAVLTPQH
jgi:hypothetical protein